MVRGPGKTRVFGGKRYRRVIARYKFKRVAEKRADEYRARGYNVRVVKVASALDGYDYTLYIRRRKSR